MMTPTDKLLIKRNASSKNKLCNTHKRVYTYDVYFVY